jgi:hypothetical protein
MIRRALALVLLLLAGAALPAQEVQHHGLVFEEWVRDTFFDGYRPESYTQRWDIPAERNLRHGGLPVNPKLARHGGPVDLGDALRQYEIETPFILIVGFWRQDGDFKRLTTIVAPRITPEQWRRLWAPITAADLRALDALIKDTRRPIAEVRRLARQMKQAPPFNRAIMQVNPKIDAHQRRLQCSLRFADVFAHLASDQDSAAQPAPMLWGRPFPGPIASPPRR